MDEPTLTISVSKLLKFKECSIIRSHYSCEDGWYSCPKSAEGCLNDRESGECTCGVDEHNAEVERVFDDLIGNIIND